MSKLQHSDNGWSKYPPDPETSREERVEQHAGGRKKWESWETGIFLGFLLLLHYPHSCCVHSQHWNMFSLSVNFLFTRLSQNLSSSLNDSFDVVPHRAEMISWLLNLSIVKKLNSAYFCLSHFCFKNEKHSLLILRRFCCFPLYYRIVLNVLGGFVRQNKTFEDVRLSFR